MQKLRSPSVPVGITSSVSPPGASVSDSIGVLPLVLAATSTDGLISLGGLRSSTISVGIASSAATSLVSGTVVLLIVFVSCIGARDSGKEESQFEGCGTNTTM